MLGTIPEAPIDRCTRCHVSITDGSKAIMADGSGSVCYYCAWTMDIEQARETGRLFAYTKDAKIERRQWYNAHHQPLYSGRIKAITTWTGMQLNVGSIHLQSVYTSNFGDRRITFSCQLPTGKLGKLEYWYGTAYYDSGDYVRLHRYSDKHTTAKG